VTNAKYQNSVVALIGVTCIMIYIRTSGCNWNPK